MRSSLTLIAMTIMEQADKKIGYAFIGLFIVFAFMDLYELLIKKQ